MNLDEMTSGLLRRQADLTLSLEALRSQLRTTTAHREQVRGALMLVEELRKGQRQETPPLTSGPPVPQANLPTTQPEPTPADMLPLPTEEERRRLRQLEEEVERMVPRHQVSEDGIEWGKG